MAPVTEIAYLKLKTTYGQNLSSLANDNHLKDLFATLKQQPGFLRQYWGVEVEDSSTFVWSIDWSDARDYEHFANSAAYVSFHDQLKSCFDIEHVKPLIFNTQFTSDTIGAREAPITEINYFNLSQDVSQEHKVAFLKAVSAIGASASSISGGQGFAGGWVNEPMTNSRDVSGQALAYNIQLGWSSIDEHIQFTKTAEFAELRKPMPSLVIPVEAFRNVRHVAFQEVRV